MDFSSGLLWSKINDILMNNFLDELANKEDHDHRIEMVRMLQSFMKFQEQFGNDRVSVLISGSSAEIADMHPLIRDCNMEFDVMMVPRNFIISRDMQPAIFEDIPDEPGFVRLEAPDILESESLKIKQVIHSGGRSRFYIVSNREESFQIHPKPPYKNILVQCIYDAFQLKNVFLMGSQQGPAFTTEYFNNALPIIELIQHPKNTLFKFLGHLGTRCLEHSNDNKSERGKKKLDEEMNENNFGKTVDYLTPPTGTEMSDIRMIADICPAIKCEGWPHKALRFFHRARVWPDQAMLNKLPQSGFHLVYKPLNPLARDSVEWRISFTQAEISLFQNMDAFRVYCYRIFKAIYYCELTLPKVLCSYHMKTIFLWACERIPSEMWVESNLAQIIMGLLDDLVHCLVTKSCPHYFIPENNLFAHMHHDFLDRLAKVVTKIRRNPEKYPLVKPGSGDQSTAQSASDADQDKPQDESLDDGIELD